MAATHFELVSDWHLAAPVERVWALIEKVEDWPLWWRGVERVETVRAGDADGVGAVRRLHWKTALPYSIDIEVEVTRVDPRQEIQGVSRGELVGTGTWSFNPEPLGTHVRYCWQVEVTRPWMRRFAWLLRALYAWNHHKIMDWGLQGARKRLGEG
jgi:uncharacterized protein YndB with AHSA1/START domain